MTCLTIDQLSCYVDGLLDGDELVEVRAHLEDCDDCQQIVSAFQGENTFIQETLKEPALPYDFTKTILNELTPFQPKKEKHWRGWKRGLSVAAGLVLAVGISAAVHPSFASHISGLFATEKVDEGLSIATDAGFVEQVDLETTSNGITFKIEEIMSDSSRISLSHQFLNEKGKVLDIYNFDHTITVVQEGGEEILTAESWTSFDDYGLFQFSMPDEIVSEQVVIHFHLTKINGVKGDWQLEVPVTINKDQTTVLALDEKKSVSDMVIQMNKIQYAPSTSTLYYETDYTEEMQQRIDDQLASLAQQADNYEMHDYAFGTELHYSIKNETGEKVVQHIPSIIWEEHEESNALLGMEGSLVDEKGRLARQDTFIPQVNSEQLTFVLEGIQKAVPADFSVPVNKSAVNKKPAAFTYEGNEMKITKVEKEVDYYFKKSIVPIGRQKYFTITLEGERERFAPELGKWVLIDDEGNVYPTYKSGTDQELTLYIYDIDKMPENFTLHLITKSVYEAVEEWEVPLY